MFTHSKPATVDRVLIPNYFDISRLKENLKKFSVVDVLHEPFQTGLVMVNKLSDENKAFFSCLQKKVKSAKRVYTSTCYVANPRSLGLMPPTIESVDFKTITVSLYFLHDLSFLWITRFGFWTSFG